MSIQFQTPIVYLITAGDASADNFHNKKNEILSLVATAAELGVSMIQIREKQLTDERLFELVQDAVTVMGDSEAMLMVNGRADIASAAGADGVHLTSSSPSAAKIREEYGEDMIIAVSTHTSDEIGRAKDDGADLAVFGPVFKTPGKPEPVGLGILSEVCREHAPFPVAALGGVDVGNYRSVLNAGAAGFAAIRCLNDVQTLTKIMKEIRSI